MSFWKSLFGGGAAKSAGPPQPVREAEYKGFHIAATPYAEAGQFQVSGLISKEVGGTRREHKFVRADRFATLEDAADFSLVKARQLIDQLGDKLFE